MAELQSIFSKLLLSLQFCLAAWQIVKLTVFGAIIKAFISCCMSKLPCGLGTLLSPSSSKLNKLSDYWFFTKYGVCLVTKEAEQASVPSQVSDETVIEIEYLGKKFHLERKEKHKLFVNRKMAYYITDPIWQSLLDLKAIGSITVFLKGHKVFFKVLIAGGVMELSEVLDCVILRNHIIKSLSFHAFVPINLSVSEEKLLKGLNLVGLFLQVNKQVYWLIPTLLSFTSAVMEFSTRLRVWIYTNVNRIFCWATHAVCDSLPLRARVWIYSLLEWVEKLKPSNDFEWRVVRGVKLTAVIGGGAKACSENASLLHPSTEVEIDSEVEIGSFVELPCDPWKVFLQFFATSRLCIITRRFGRYADTFEVDCGMDEYKNLRTFIDCLVKNRSGSLEYCEPNGRVCSVRSFEESVLFYAKSGFPQVYELELENAVVE